MTQAIGDKEAKVSQMGVVIGKRSAVKATKVGSTKCTARKAPTKTATKKRKTHAKKASSFVITLKYGRRQIIQAYSENSKISSQKGYESIQTVEALRTRHDRAYICRLPTELIQRIARYIPDDFSSNDENLRVFMLSCREIHSALNHWCSGIWQHRFVQSYDLVPGSTAAELKDEYSRRQRLIHFLYRSLLQIDSGKLPIDLAVLKLLRTLIIEACGSPNLPTINSHKALAKNFDAVWQLAVRTGILEVINKHIFPRRYKNNGSEPEPTVEPLLQTIQLTLAEWALSSSLGMPYNAEFSQQAVYGHPIDFPFFLDVSTMRELNLTNMLHFLNFFQTHISAGGDGTIMNLVNDLRGRHVKKLWDCKLQPGSQELGKHWKGTYAHLYERGFASSDKINLRVCPDDLSNAIYMDTFETDGHDSFHDLYLDFSKPTKILPPLLEKHLHSLPPEGIRETVRRESGIQAAAVASGLDDVQVDGAVPDIDYHQFIALNSRADPEYDDPWHCIGNVHALPAQNGIPGFQRVTMLKWPAERGSNHTKETQDYAVRKFLQLTNTVTNVGDLGIEMWAYEGIVMPGGRLMIGRYWAPDETPPAELEGNVHPDYRRQRLSTGPFIYWNVDPMED